MQSKSPGAAVQKTFLAFRAIADEPGASVGVRELAARLGFAPATTHRALGALMAAGLVVRDAGTARYSLSLDAFRLGFQIAGRAPWRDMSLPRLRALSKACGEMSAFAILDRTRLQMQTVARAHSAHGVAIVETDGWKSLRAGASGLAILAFLPRADQDHVIEASPEPETRATIVDPAEMRRELDAIADRGYALTRGQRIPGAVGIGAPVFLPEGGVLGSVYVSLPEQRFDPGRESALADLVRATGQGIGEDIRVRR